MTTGSAVAKANASLDAYVADLAFVKLHVGDPGAAGTANAASVTTRVAITWGASANGLKSITNAPNWPTWAGTAQTITHISAWDLSSGGVFKRSEALSSGVAVAVGGSFTLSGWQLAAGPVAA